MLDVMKRQTDPDVRLLQAAADPTRLAILRFPTLEAMQALHDDPEYQPLKALRQRVTKTDFVVVEGL